MKSRYKEKLKPSKAHEDNNAMIKKFYSVDNINRMSDITNDGIFNNSEIVFNLSYKSYERLLNFTVNYFYNYAYNPNRTISADDVLITDFLGVMEKKNAIIRVSDEETIKKCGHSFEISTCFDLSKYYKDDKDDELKPSVMVATNALLTGEDSMGLKIRYNGEITVNAHKYKLSMGEDTCIPLMANTPVKFNNKTALLLNKQYSRHEMNLIDKTLLFTSYNELLSRMLQTVYKHITQNDKSKIFNTMIHHEVSYIDVTVDNDEPVILFMDYLVWYLYTKLNQNDTKHINPTTSSMKKLMDVRVSKALSEIDDIIKLDESSIDKFIDLWKGDEYDTPQCETFDVPMQGLILEYNDMVIKFSTNVSLEDEPDLFGVMEIQYSSINISTRLHIFINKETMNLYFYNHIIDKDFCKRILKAWYGIQVALGHPAIRTIVERDCVINDTTEIDTSMPKTRRRVTTYYNMTGERIEYVLSGGSGKHFKRHTMSWYVIGHWRKIGDNKKTFVKGHWKGPLRDMLSTEPHRERELKEVKV